MAFDAFLYFPGDSKVVGETMDSEMSKNKAFELREFSFGAENIVNIGSETGGAGAGKATFKEFNVKKRTDTASCSLFQQLCVGKHFDEAILELRRSGGSSETSGSTFMKFSFKLVMVQEMSWSGADGDDVLEEDVIFQYGAIKIEYFQQTKDGKMVKPKTSSGAEALWSRVLNKATYDAGK